MDRESDCLCPYSRVFWSASLFTTVRICRYFIFVSAKIQETSNQLQGRKCWQVTSLFRWNTATNYFILLWRCFISPYKLSSWSLIVCTIVLDLLVSKWLTFSTVIYWMLKISEITQGVGLTISFPKLYRHNSMSFRGITGKWGCSQEQ